MWMLSEYMMFKRENLNTPPQLPSALAIQTAGINNLKPTDSQTISLIRAAYLSHKPL
jgi:hypothetical protein